VGFNEFGMTGKEAGDLVLAGWNPALSLAMDMICAIIACMECLGVSGLWQMFRLGSDLEGFKVCGEWWDRLECICSGGFGAV
jgi:hypothetical protein